MKRRSSLLILLLLLVTVLAISGCWLKNISTPYYTQITSYYCGAATAQMILGSEKINISVDQDTLYNYAHSHNQCSGWAIDPVGLREVLNHYYPDGHFFVHAPTNQEEGVKKQAYTIDRYGVPPAALIYGAAHWVVVRGVLTDYQPTTTPTYMIYGFFVNDPWYGSTSLGENKYIEINNWKTDYFNGTNVWCGATGDNKRYISVVDPDPVPEVTLKFPELRARRPNVLSELEIQKITTEYIKKFKEQKEFLKYFENATEIINSSKIGTPVLVMRSDLKMNGYYIVPLQQKEMTAGALLLDAYSGQFKEVSLVRKAIDYRPILQMKQAQTLFINKLPVVQLSPETLDKLQLPKTQTIKLNTHNVKITRMERVWEPSPNSQNPYYPLWRVEGQVMNKEPVVVLGYMDAARKVLTRLDSIQQYGGGR